MNDEIERGEYGGVIDANGREVYVGASIIDGAPGAVLQGLSMGQQSWRPVVELRLCDAQLDALIGDLLKARRESRSYIEQR